MSLFDPYSRDYVPSGRFRVILVAAGRWQDPIRCKLIHRKLDGPSEKHPYKALSYVWGSSLVTDTIYLDGLPSQITLNLSCALRYLRKVDEDTFLWVDAICINQQSDWDRSEQVSIMQLIYKKAEEVVVFMGDGRGHRISRSQLMDPPSSPTTTLHGYGRDKTFLTEMLRTCHSSGPRRLSSSLTAATCAMGLILLFSDQNAVEQGCLELVELNERTRYHIFECLRAFVISPWWRRIWVVQEIAVSAAATIQYGNITLPWETLVATANVWSQSETRQVASNAGIEPENLKVFALLANQVAGLEQTRKRWRKGGTDLVRLLQEFSDRQASDDRDKVYGLLSLTKQDQNYIKPNYELDVFETYRATVLALIGNTGSLACWAGDQKRKFNRGLPSWIPDWSTAVDNGDKRRMDLFDSYSANCGWNLKVIESERDYWYAVEDEMELLVNSPAGKAGRLPASLNRFVMEYIDLLMQRAKSLHSYRINGDELEQSGIDRLKWENDQGLKWYKGEGVTFHSIMDCLKWCEEHEVLPRSGIGLLRRWICDLENRKEREFLTPKDFFRSLAIPESQNDRSLEMRIQDLVAATNEEDVDMEHRMSNARFLIYKIEAIILGPETILVTLKGMEISLAIESLTDLCWRLSSICTLSRLASMDLPSRIINDETEATKDAINPSKLFTTSYALQGTASWLTESQLMFERPKLQDWGIGLSPCKNAVVPQRSMTMQMVLVNGVTVCGRRQLGWGDTRSALTTLVSWLYLSGPVMFSGTPGKRTVQLNNCRIRKFAKTIIGGMCRRGGSYHKADDSALGPLEDWLRQSLMVRRVGDSQLSPNPDADGFVFDTDLTPDDWMRTSAEAWLSSDWMDDGSDPVMSLEQWERGSLAAKDFTVPPNPFLEDIQVATDGRVFFLTENGSMGLGPASMQKKDSIHILPSGRAHFVLRCKPEGMKPPDPNAPEWIRRLESDQHELIGDCYLHTDDGLDSQIRPEEEPVIEGSLPFEVLGARYLRGKGQPMRETVMLV